MLAGLPWATFKKPLSLKSQQDNGQQGYDSGYGKKQRGGQKAETEELPPALVLIAEKMGGMQLADGVQLSSQLKGFAARNEAQADPPKVKTRPERLGEAAEALRNANKQFTTVAVQVKKQRAMLQEWEKKIEEKATGVAKQEALLEKIYGEGENQPQSFVQQLISRTPEQLALDGVIDLEKEMELDDEEVDEAAKQAVPEAKMQVLEDLQEGARSYTTKLQEHISKAKELAAKSKEAIRQDVKKRMIDANEAHRDVTHAMASRGGRDLFGKLRIKAKIEHSSTRKLELPRACCRESRSEPREMQRQAYDAELEGTQCVQPTRRSLDNTTPITTECTAKKKGKAEHIDIENKGQKPTANRDQELIICGDGSGGTRGDDARYRRCGWGWVLMERVDGQWTPTAECSGPLPRERQSDNRAQITALLDSQESTTGNITFYTDSEILCKGWNNKRYLTKCYKKGHGDLWKRIGRALDNRGDATIRVLQIESHVSIDEAQMGYYHWARAAAQRVTARIAQSTRELFEKVRPVTWEEKEEAKSGNEWSADKFRDLEHRAEVLH
ncbi:unnamed protein product [Prorocentrum cordatum]|uniref:RNase H type-1 domain-containing protein n=1 Tax=Prorocentrum cordatum TaxID=2364126 RepID=A0ABN9XDB8_9DINO|nr:unnamed protein product [Polarella glacialis]